MLGLVVFPLGVQFFLSILVVFIPDNGVLKEGTEHHEEADRQVHVQRLHVRDLRKRPKQGRYLHLLDL